MILYKSTGILRYGFTHLVVDVDSEFVRYYRSLLPKYIEVQPPMYGAHISVVRKEIAPKMEVWKKHEGEKIEFNYSPIVYFGKPYFWLNVYSIRLEEIREELGLPNVSIYSTPPEEYKKTFHITIANSKHIL